MQRYDRGGAASTTDGAATNGRRGTDRAATDGRRGTDRAATGERRGTDGDAHGPLWASSADELPTGDGTADGFAWVDPDEGDEDDGDPAETRAPASTVARLRGALRAVARRVRAAVTGEWRPGGDGRPGAARPGDGDPVVLPDGGWRVRGTAEDCLRRGDWDDLVSAEKMAALGDDGDDDREEGVVPEVDFGPTTVDPPASGADG